MPDIEDSTATAALLPVESSKESAAWDMGGVFPGVVTSALVALIAAFAVFTKYGEIDTDEFYMFYIHVAIMIFVGFGFLMTFLRRYSLGAVSLNFLTSCMMMLFAILLVRPLLTPPLLLSGPCSMYQQSCMLWCGLWWRSSDLSTYARDSCMRSRALTLVPNPARAGQVQAMRH